jgi:hypothetical protein
MTDTNNTADINAAETATAEVENTLDFAKEFQDLMAIGLPIFKMFLQTVLEKYKDGGFVEIVEKGESFIKEILNDKPISSEVSVTPNTSSTFSKVVMVNGGKTREKVFDDDF